MRRSFTVDGISKHEILNFLGVYNSLRIDFFVTFVAFASLILFALPQPAIKYSKLTPCSIVSIGHFEQVNADWGLLEKLQNISNFMHDAD